MAVQQSIERNKENLLLNQLNAIKLHHPKLLRIKEIEKERRIVPNLTKEYEKENKALKTKIQDLKEMDKQLKENDDNMQLQKNLSSFYKNPFSYMDYLVQKYFKEKSNLLEHLQVKDQITNDFSTFCHEIQGKLDSFTQGELLRIKALEKRIDNKLNIERKKGNERENEELLGTQPLQQSELRNLLFSANIGEKGDNNSNPKKNLIDILTQPDTEQMIIHDKTSSFHQEEIFKQTLACIKGNKIILPKQSFLACDNIFLKDLQKQEMKDSSRIATIRQKTDWEVYIASQLDPKRAYIDNPIKARTKKQKIQEKKLYDTIINQSCKGFNHMDRVNEENEAMLSYVQNKLDKNFNRDAIKVGLTKMSIYETNLDEIKGDFKKAEQNCVDLKERKKLMENAYSKTQKKIAHVLGEQVYNGSHQLDDEDIDELYKQYGEKKGKTMTKAKFKPKIDYFRKNLKYY